MSDEPVLKISSSEGIIINARKGDKVVFNADRIFIKGVKQDATGGEILFKVSTEFIQKNNEVSSSNGGKAITEIANGGSAILRRNIIRNSE